MEHHTKAGEMMFKNQLNPTRLILIGIWALLLIVGCQATNDEANKPVTVTQIISNEQEVASPDAMTITPTHLITQTATSTLIPIPSPTSSPTLQPGPTPLSTETVTPTPWPTLPPDEAANKVMSLLADNQNPDCLLPCWWGATPGQTHWQDIEPFLNSFAIKIDEVSIGASVKIPLPEPIALPSFGYYVSYGWNDSGVIDEIYVDSMNIPGYDPKMIVTLYGIPDEVWLKTFSELLPGEVLPFQLIVIYQEQGISFRYYVDATRTGETVTACFAPGIEVKRPDLFPASPTIYVWEPGQYKTIDEIANIPQETYFPLEEKTDLTPETLYEKFTNPSEQPCIDTPADLWRY